MGAKCCSKESGGAEVVDVVEKFDIFFSHKQSDAQDAGQNIIAHLRNKRPGIKIWVDIEQDPTEEGMEAGIKGCTAVVWYCTENIPFSKYCVQELQWALQYEKKIILMLETDPRHHAPEMGVLRDRMPDELKFVFDQNVAIPFYRDPDHKEVSMQRVLDIMDGKKTSAAHGGRRQTTGDAPARDVIISAVASGFREADDAVLNAHQKLLRGLKNNKPQLLICNMTCNFDCEKVHAEISKLINPKSQVFLGCTSSAGVLVNQTWHSQDNTGFGMWGIYDPDGCYSVGHSSTVEPKDIRAAIEEAMKDAAKSRSESGQAASTDLPDFVVTFPHPGCEEVCLGELKAVLGGNVPVIGGSSADNSLAGEWKQISSKGGVTGAGFTFALCWPSVLVHAGFCSGFHPTEHRGKITKLHDKRHIATINGEKAAIVYDKWSGGKFTELMKEKGDSVVLGPSTYTPLAIQRGKDVDGDPMYVVIHPHLIKKEDMSVTTFKNLEEGMELVCLAGTRQNLVSRLSKVVTSILRSAPFKVADVIGSYQIFCGGVMMCIKEDMPIVAEKLGIVLEGTPSMGGCTFGEQGTFVDGAPGHGNLMFASLVFSRIKKASSSAKRAGSMQLET